MVFNSFFWFLYFYCCDKLSMLPYVKRLFMFGGPNINGIEVSVLVLRFTLHIIIQLCAFFIRLFVFLLGHFIVCMIFFLFSFPFLHHITRSINVICWKSSNSRIHCCGQSWLQERPENNAFDLVKNYFHSLFADYCLIMVSWNIPKQKVILWCRHTLQKNEKKPFYASKTNSDPHILINDSPWHIYPNPKPKQNRIKMSFSSLISSE